MTNELKEKILEGLKNVILAKNYALEYEDYEKAIAKFLAIIDEGIEKVIPESMPFIVSENMEERSGWNACIEQMIRNNKLNKNKSMNLNQQALHKINILLQKLAEDIFEPGTTQLVQYTKMADEIEEIINELNQI